MSSNPTKAIGNVAARGSHRGGEFKGISFTMKLINVLKYLR